MRDTSFLVMLSLVFAPYAAIAQSERSSLPTISADAIQAAVTQVRQHKAKDRFDAGPDMSALVGKSFLMETSLKAAGNSNTICEGSPFYNYTPDSAKFEVFYGRRYEPNDYDPAIAPSHSEHPSQFAFSCSVKTGKRYRGENSFGAVANVEVRNEISAAFVSSQPMDEPYFENFVWKTQADSETARNLAKHVRIRIRGIIGEWSSGHPIKCSARTEAATINFPEEKNQYSCFINAHIVEAEVVDSTTGEILHTGIASIP